ncbi:T cell receptor gamma 2, partial [Clarias magur]
MRSVSECDTDRYGNRYLYKVFGSGTQLIVTDPGKDKVKEPQVSVYPMSRQSNGKSVLLCQARGMFPDLVRFKWKAVDRGGGNMNLNSEERLEQRDKDPDVRITSMLIVEQQKAMNNKFICSVQHTNNAEKELVIPKEDTESKPGLVTTCAPRKAEKLDEEEIMDSDNVKDQVKKPQVSVYPVSRPQANGKRVLLCQARGMFPDLVRFTWQAEDQSGRKVELKDDEQLEQRDKDQEVQITSMLIVDQHKAMNSNFTCSVQHDSSFDNQIIIIPR